jgi:hypothetical protein
VNLAGKVLRRSLTMLLSVFLLLIGKVILTDKSFFKLCDVHRQLKAKTRPFFLVKTTGETAKTRGF